MEGDSHITSPRRLTAEAHWALGLVEDAIQRAQLVRMDYKQPFALCVVATALLPTAVLWQDGPLLWIHPHASPVKSIEWYPAAIARLALKGLKAFIEHFGCSPSLLIVPYTMAQVQTLAACTDDWAILLSTFDGRVDNHLPKHPLLSFVSYHPIVFPRVTSQDPLKDGLMVFTDGSKTGLGAYAVNGTVYQKQFSASSPQIVECMVVLEVLQLFKCSLNIISDPYMWLMQLNAWRQQGLLSQPALLHICLMRFNYVF